MKRHETMLLSDWVQLPKETRMAHIDLSSPCVLVKKRQWTSRMHRMFEWMGIENDVPNMLKAKIHRIHACQNHSRGTTICCNPLHWWVGSMSENVMSMSKEKRTAGGKACNGRPCTWSDKIWETRQKNKHRQFISTVDGFLGTISFIGGHHRKIKAKKGENQPSLNLRVPDEDIAAFEGLTPLERMMAMEMLDG